MNNESAAWFPLTLTSTSSLDVHLYRQALSDHPVRVDLNVNQTAARLLEKAIVPVLDDIVERDSLPALCHLLNGWGNAPYRNRHLLDYYMDFVRPNQSGRPAIPQCEPEGDFHAGQSLAYALMAGVPPDSNIANSSVTLADLIHQVQGISIDDPAELGHFLFAVGWSNMKYDAPTFKLGSRAISFERLIDEAIDSHRFGHFNVCRKFHLTEGLCALAASPSYADKEGLRGYAQQFLDGQLETLLLVGAIHGQVKQLENGGGSRNDLATLREDMLLGSFIENEYYYVGHAAELYGLAKMCGFEVQTVHESALFDAVNVLNSWLDRYLPRIKVRESFLHLGHYRRGITLLGELLRPEQEDRRSREAILSAFTLRSAINESDQSTAPCEISDDFYNVSDHEDPRGLELDEITQIFNNSSQFLAAKGSAFHFRRIIPPTWPRAVHYEFLVTDIGISIDLHVELIKSHPKRDAAIIMLSRIPTEFEGAVWGVENDWLGSGFALRHLLVDSTPERAVHCMNTLITATKTKLDSVFFDDTEH